MQIEQVKPEVDYYVQVGFFGCYFPGENKLSKCDLGIISKTDFRRNAIKSKFRPVYKKD